jgi:hypothetical protein
VFGVLYGRQLYLHYRAYGAEVAGFVAVAEKTPPGGKAMGLVFDRKSAGHAGRIRHPRLPGFYPAMRPALGSMVPPAYCGLRHMPCRLKVGPEFATNVGARELRPREDAAHLRLLLRAQSAAGLDLFRGLPRHGRAGLPSPEPGRSFASGPGPIVPDPPPPPRRRHRDGNPSSGAVSAHSADATLWQSRQAASTVWLVRIGKDLARLSVLCAPV